MKETRLKLAGDIPGAFAQLCRLAFHLVLPLIPVADQMAGLRLLRQLAVKDHVVVVRGYLGSPDHTVKREAVNTMRVLHGEAPIENLTVFQAIEMAKEWQKKA